jgi:hypothetical protein
MLKQCLLALIAAGAISIGAQLTAAQDGPFNGQQSQAPQGNGGRRQGPADSARRTVELTKQLKLSSDQQTKVQDALQSERSEIEVLHQDISLSEQDRHAKVMEIHKSTEKEIRAFLDSNQQKKWDEMQAKRRQWMQLKHPE